MNIIQLDIENIKKLRVVSITPAGNVVQISGANGSGKSSTLDSIFYALTGTTGHPSQPIRKGQQKATIKLALGDGGQIEYIVRREFTQAGTRLFVESPDGALYKTPQRLLDALLGALSFDPLAFTTMKPQDQLDTLRRLVPLDVDVDALERQNLRDYELRRDWNRRVASFKDRVATLEEGVDEAMETAMVDVEALTAQMASASEHNAAIEQLRVSRARMTESIATRRTDAQQKRLAARRLLEEAQAMEDAARDDENTLDSLDVINDPIDVSDLRQQISAALKVNALRGQQERQRAAHAAAVKELESALATSNGLTEAMDERTAQKQAAIARAKMPVDGLGFGDGMVLFNDLPFDQASQAEQIRVSFALAVAANPRLRVVLIREGSLLDERNLAVIAEMASEHDCQVWLEKVDTSGRVGVCLEDGAVTSIDGEEAGRPVAEEVGA